VCGRVCVLPDACLSVCLSVRLPLSLPHACTHAHTRTHTHTQVVDQALSLPGFKEDAPATYTTTGFARNAVLGIADKVCACVRACVCGCECGCVYEAMLIMPCATFPAPSGRGRGADGRHQAGL
jgi:hypothetical protein